MTKKKQYISMLKKLSLFSFLFAFIAPVLSGCSSEPEKNTHSDIPDTTTSVIDSSSPNNQDVTASSQIQDDTDKKLTIDQAHCIGCGKCPRFAPNNFQMDPHTRKAVVTSQENTESTSVQRAVSACPTDAISI